MSEKIDYQCACFHCAIEKYDKRDRVNKETARMCIFFSPTFNAFVEGNVLSHQHSNYHCYLDNDDENCDVRLHNVHGIARAAFA